MLASVSFLRNSPGVEATRAALADAHAASSALQELLDALSVHAPRVEIESDISHLPPEMVQLLASCIQALEVLQHRAKENLRNVAKINEYEVCLAKKKEQTQQDIQEVAEEIVAAKLRNVELRSELAELNHDYSKAARQMQASLEAEGLASQQPGPSA